MENIIIILLLVAILVCVFIYIKRSKKKGVKCIGCPNKNCSGNCSSIKK